MAQEETEQPAESGTQSATPVWDSFNGEMYPFLNLKEEQKREGFRIKFLSDKPRKETPNNFDQKDTDFWFDVEHEGETYTWTISQKSLIMELQKHKPLSGKSFDVRLIPVDENFKKQFPKYKGKDRYQVIPVSDTKSETEDKEEKKAPDSEKKTAEESSEPDIEVEEIAEE